MVLILVKPWLIDLEKKFGSSTNALLLAENFICGSYHNNGASFQAT